MKLLIKIKIKKLGFKFFYIKIKVFIIQIILKQREYVITQLRIITTFSFLSNIPIFEVSVS